MSNQFGRDQNHFQRPERESNREENRNISQGRGGRDEDGGWARNREDETRGQGAERNEERGFDESNQRWGQGANRWQGPGSSGSRGYSGYGDSGSGYGGSGHGGNSGRSDSGGMYGGLRSGYASTSGYGLSSGYSPTGYDRDRLGAQRDQGLRGRDANRGGFAGRGPKGYTRTDERIREDVCDRLSEDDEVDASEISVRAENGEVTLEGSTETRRQKHRAEEIAADVSGVRDVHNNVRVRKGLLTELKDKVTGEEEPSGGHAGSGTKAATSQTAHNRQ